MFQPEKDTTDIHLQDSLEVPETVVCHRTDRTFDASVVKEDIDAAELGLGLCDEGCDGLLVRDIAGEC
jgi:hypothetical protein